MVTIAPATWERWADLERLFGSRGACGGCWCMTWRLPRKEFERGKGARNRARLIHLTKGPVPPGVLAYQDREPAGWCSVAPRPEFAALARSRVLKPVDERPVWSVSCLFVRKEHRRRGLAVRLLEAAVDFAAGHGATIVEGYPSTPPSRKFPDVFLWTGTPDMYLRAGFEEVARFAKTRPIMRWFLAHPPGNRLD